MPDPHVIHGVLDETEGHPVADWLRERQAGETKLDYPEWVEQRYQDRPDDYCRTCFESYADGGDGWDGECPCCADRRAALELCAVCFEPHAGGGTCPSCAAESADSAP
jgi:hypothetical protein